MSILGSLVKNRLLYSSIGECSRRYGIFTIYIPIVVLILVSVTTINHPHTLVYALSMYKAKDR